MNSYGHYENGKYFSGWLLCDLSFTVHLFFAFCAVGLGTYGSDDVVFSGTEANAIRSSRISDFGTFEQSLGFRIEDAVDLSRSM